MFENVDSYYGALKLLMCLEVVKITYNLYFPSADIISHLLCKGGEIWGSTKLPDSLRPDVSRKCLVFKSNLFLCEK